jgi:hypothetical protein
VSRYVMTFLTVAMTPLICHGQALLNSWEGQAEGWRVHDDTHTVSFNGKVGVTHGESSMEVDVPAGSSNHLRGGMTREQFAALKKHPRVAIDVTLPGDPRPAWAELQIQLQIQGAYTRPGNDTPADFNFVFPPQSINRAGTHTLAWAHAEQLALPEDATLRWGEFRLITNAAGGWDPPPGKVYFDNFRALAEAE